MPEQLEHTLGYMERLVREDTRYNNAGRTAFTALTGVAEKLGQDPSGRGANFFRTFGKVNIFPYDSSRSANGHGVGYCLDEDGKIVVFTGSSIVRSNGEFMDGFARSSSSHMDKSQREQFLGDINELEIYRRIGDYRPC